MLSVREVAGEGVGLLWLRDGRSAVLAQDGGTLALVTTVLVVVVWRRA